MVMARFGLVYKSSPGQLARGVQVARVVRPGEHCHVGAEVALLHVAAGWAEMEARGLCGRSPRLVTGEVRRVRAPLRLCHDEAPHLLQEEAAGLVLHALALLVETGAPVNM